MEGCKVCVLEGVLLLWRRVFFKWRVAKFVFRRGYFCYGGVQNLCLGGGIFAVEEGVFLKWKGAKFLFRREYFSCGGRSVHFMFWRGCF